MKNFICKILGHDWKYNFIPNPSKRSCKRCNDVQHVDFEASYGINSIRNQIKWLKNKTN